MLWYKVTVIVYETQTQAELSHFNSIKLLCTEPVSPNRPREQVHHSNAKARREFTSSALGPKSLPAQWNPTRAPNKGVWQLIYRQFFVSVTGVAGVTWLARQDERISCLFLVNMTQVLETVVWSLTKPVHPKGNQFWIFTGRTDAEVETPILWPPDAKNWLIWNDPDAGKDWRQEENWTTEREMVGWHHRLDEHEFEQDPRVGDGQGSLACFSPRGHKESHTTEQLNWTELNL